MKKDNKNTVIIGLLITIVFMSLGFAVLSAKIDRDALTTSLSGNRYQDVKISTITSVETVGSARDIKSYISDEREVTLFPEIIEAGDSVTYTINLMNDGNEAAILDSIEIDNYYDHLVYTIDNLNAGDIIYAGDSKMFSISISYSDEFVGDIISELPEITLRLNFGD